MLKKTNKLHKLHKFNKNKTKKIGGNGENNTKQTRSLNKSKVSKKITIDNIIERVQKLIAIVNFIFTSLNINNENSQNHLVKKYTKFENDVEYYNQNFIEKYKELDMTSNYMYNNFQSVTIHKNSSNNEKLNTLNNNNILNDKSLNVFISATLLMYHDFIILIYELLKAKNNKHSKEIFFKDLDETEFLIKINLNKPKMFKLSLDLNPVSKSLDIYDQLLLNLFEKSIKLPSYTPRTIRNYVKNILSVLDSLSLIKNSNTITIQFKLPFSCFDKLTDSNINDSATLTRNIKRKNPSTNHI